jgi:hypothetical protein
MGIDQRIVEEIIGRYGRAIDLEPSPDVIITIIREYKDDVDVSEFHPPVPTRQDPTTSDIMKELLKLSRDVGKIKKHLGA